MEMYAGRYTNEMYSESVVSFKNEELSLNIVGLGWVGKLDHWQYDTFRATWRAPERDKSFVTFTLTPSGDVSTLRVDGLADFLPVPLPPPQSGNEAHQPFDVLSGSG